MENRQQEWDQVRKAARLYLEKPTSIPSAPSLKQYTRLLRLWAYPAFTEQAAWHVFRRGVPGNETFLVRRVTWNQRSDAKRLLGDPMHGLREGFHPDPTVESRDRPIETGVALEHLERLRQLSIPMGAIDGTVQLDGAAFGLELLAGRVLVEWRDRHPPEWQGLVSWFEDFRLWLDDTCTQPGTPQHAPLVARPSA